MQDFSDAGYAAAAARMPAELSIEVNGNRSVLRLEDPRYGLGRALSNEIAYPNDGGLSREHLVIERDGSDWVLRDLGSTNGTLINGVSIAEPRVLRSGDRITAGQATLVYRESGDPGAGAVVFTEDDSTTTGFTTMPESVAGLSAGESADGKRHMQALITAGRELATHLALDRLFDLILDLSIEAAGAARGRQ